MLACPQKQSNPWNHPTRLLSLQVLKCPQLMFFPASIYVRPYLTAYFFPRCPNRRLSHDPTHIPERILRISRAIHCYRRSDTPPLERPSSTASIGVPVANCFESDSNLSSVPYLNTDSALIVSSLHFYHLHLDSCSPWDYHHVAAARRPSLLMVHLSAFPEPCFPNLYALGVRAKMIISSSLL